MTIQELHSALMFHKVNPVYMFTGEEIGIMNIYIEQIAKIKKFPVYRADSFVEAYNSIRKQGVFKKNFVYVIRDDKDVTVENEKISKLLEEGAWQDIVIFLFTSLDKRTKFYKQYKDTLVEFNHLEPANLRKYVKRELKGLSDNECDFLSETCGCNYSRILLETNKIKCYVEKVGGTESKALFDLVKQGIIYTPPKDAIFDWCDAMMNCKRTAFALYQECLAVGEASLPLLTVLYNNIKQTLQLQTCTSKDVAKSTGLTGWQIQCAKKYVNKYKDEELKYYMELIRKMEVGIKTGKVDEEVTVPYVMATMLGGY